VALVIKTMISSKSGVQNTGSRNNIQQKLAPRAYQEDAGRKDQGWTLLDGGSAQLLSDKDDPAVTDAAAAAIGEDNGTYQDPCK
jgi:hypothetical protein